MIEFIAAFLICKKEILKNSLKVFFLLNVPLILSSDLYISLNLKKLPDMNNLKLKGLTLGLICLFAFNVNAQTTKEGAQSEMRKEQRAHKTPEEKAQKLTERMTEKLGLNENQQEDVYALNLQEIKNREEIRSRMKDKLQAEQMARYQTVLTTDQYAKLEKFQAERQAKGKKGHQGKPDRAHNGKKNGMHHGKGNAEMKAQKMTEKMTEKLGLNEKQQADILAINMQEVSNRDRIRIKMEQKVRNEQMARYKTVLTQEQYATLEKMQIARQAKRAEHKGKHGNSHQKPLHKN
ncbi:MAG: protein CpxP [Saprospiraceae bacterium]|jgi:protein CpxP